MKKFVFALLLMTTPCYAQSSPPPPALPTTNTAVSITTGNTFQTILSSVASGSNARRSLTIQNNNASDSCWLAFGVGVTAGTATKAGSILLLAGGSYVRYFPYVPSDEIEATCATTADTLYVAIQ